MPAVTAFGMEDYYLWDCSVIRAEGAYHLFCSRWKKTLGFGWNWLFHSEVIRAEAERPEGPYVFRELVFPRRGRAYFDGMSTHNPAVLRFRDRFYLYYMGTVYGGEAPAGEPEEAFVCETWNRKRIGLAAADSASGEFRRGEEPLLEPRSCAHWDCTCTTNPTATVLPDGKTYLIYKSRRAYGAPLALGVCTAERPEGPFRRLSDEPIFDFADPNLHVEDPFLWYDAARKVFCLIAKDDVKNGARGITGEWGGGFYAESRDCVHFEIAEDPAVYLRNGLQRADGRTGGFCNLERPSLLFDESGRPTHLFLASGEGKSPYAFEKETEILCVPLKNN